MSQKDKDKEKGKEKGGGAKRYEPPKITRHGRLEPIRATPI